MDTGGNYSSVKEFSPSNAEKLKMLTIHDKSKILVKGGEIMCKSKRSELEVIQDDEETKTMKLSQMVDNFAGTTS